MAAKTVKATTQQPTVDYAAMSEKQLHDQLHDKRAELLSRQREHKAGELPNPRTIGALRKDVARILTALHSKSGAPKKNDDKSGEEE